MRDIAPTTSRSSRLADISPRPIAIPGTTFDGVERRNLHARRMLPERICEEFIEMPGTSLTLPQAARLFGLHADVCSRIFAELVRDGQLELAGDNRYRLRSAA